MAAANIVPKRSGLSDLSVNVNNVGLGGRKNEVRAHDASGAVSPKLDTMATLESMAANSHAHMTQNGLECRDYIDPIYANDLKSEGKTLLPTNYMKNKQPELTPEMRSVCLDWITECANRFDMSMETLFLTVYTLDHFLAVKPIQRKRMQLVTMVCLIIASKYEEIYPPHIREYIHISAKAFTREDMLRYEHSILHALNYSLTVPTAFSFITRMLLELKPEGAPETAAEKKLRHCTYFISECAMLNMTLYLEHLPSLLGAASIYAARKLCKQEPYWPSCMHSICDYDVVAIQELATKLIENATAIKAGNLHATVKRYSEEKRSCVSKLI
eukprot:TRINITY_DN4379_c1_g1_i1.p2 TRINITY_DN4379_c1_g1~~TRINITY_DN4379_c1_g1_i1.p2  ORF type:complete len:349 (+),score=163.69 TRINITY_DN4379_c1_g1_i1:63-1049(+)